MAHNTVLERRRFRRVSTTTATLFLAGALAACGSDTSATNSSSAGSAPVTMQLSWLKDVTASGELFALENGYYTEAGLDGMTESNILANSGSTSAESVVVSGQALVGMNSMATTGPAIAQGAPLVVIASLLQENPYTLLSLQERTPIRSIEDLKGKRVGVQSINQVLWKGFLEANGLSESDVETVPVEYSLAPLETGDIDAYLSYRTNQPITAQQDGYTPVLLNFADHGMAFTSNLYFVTKDTLERDRDRVKSFMIGEVRGWTDSVQNPAAAAQIAYDKYGADLKLDLAQQTAQMNAQVGLMVTADTNTHGLMTLSDQLISDNLAALELMGTDLDAEQVFDPSLIEEIYSENPTLVVQLPIDEER